MAINIKNLEERIQKKAYAVTSNTPTSELGDIVEAALLATNSLREYDSADLLPTATSSNEKLAYVKKDNSIRFNNGTKWDSLVSGAAQASSSGGGTPTTNLYGTTAVYKMGGVLDLSPYGTNTIEKVPVSTDGNATDVGDLAAAAIGFQNGNSSSTDGFSSGGRADAPTYAVGGITQIDKFPFATDANASDVGDLFQGKGSAATNNSSTNGYVSFGGATPAVTEGSITKFPFAISSATGTDVGDAVPAFAPSGLAYAGGSSDPSHGYVGGGYGSIPNPTQNVIQRFAFASDENATDVGNAVYGGIYYNASGHQSTTHGYISGGISGNPSYPGRRVDISKYPFASSGADATDVGDLTVARYGPTGSSSTTHAYSMAGNSPSSSDTNIIDKYSTSADANATDVGDLVVATQRGAGANN